MKVISMRSEKNLKLEKILKNTTIVFVGLFILSLIFSGSLSNWFGERIKEYATSLGQSRQAQEMSALSDYTTSMFIGDIQIAMALVALTFGICYVYVSSKINKDLLIAGLAVLIIFDLFRISERGSEYVEASLINNQFEEPDYIKVIKQQDAKEPYRIINLKQDGSYGSLAANLNYNVYFQQEDFYGYSAAKPRTYQDLIEAAGVVNLTLFRMLGVKYVVLDRQFNQEGFVPIQQSKSTFVYNNTSALPRIYFVDSVAQKTPVEILNEIKTNSFDPKKLAFVENMDFKFDKCDSTSKAKITEYKDESLTADVTASSNNFLFFGTTYLPSWHAFVDGKEIQTHKTDYGFIGIVVPQGKHKIEFVYDPKVFEIGKTLSIILNILLFGELIFAVFMSKKKSVKVTAENA